VMDDFNTYKINQFQIIQHKIDEIEVLIKIDEALRNKGPSVKNILDEISKRFKQKMGANVKIKVHDVKEIPVDPKSHSIKVIVSKINKK
ncbi:MAG: hypothetical protein BV457_05730, partial [Thermoplasmata archaeon M9B1D]